ncbi:MAG: DPP IV N-terminal domain-containing protein [Idiomarina sp.]
MSLLRWLLLFVLVSTSISFTSPAQASEQLVLEDLFEAPALDNRPPRKIQFVPKAEQVSYLRGSAEQPEFHSLWVYDIPTATHQLLVSADTNAEAVAAYRWSDDGRRVLVLFNGQLHLLDTQSEKSELRQLTGSDYQVSEARFSPRGDMISFVHKYNFYTVNIASGDVTQHTFSETSEQRYASADAIATTELGRARGYWWSPDQSFVALTKASSSGTQVELGILELVSNTLRGLPLADGNAGYLISLDWLPDSQRLSYQWQARNQQQLDLWLAPVAAAFGDSGQGGFEPQSLLVKETSPTWINLHQDLYFLNDNKHFVWSSERSGFKHIYLYRLDGKLIRQLTSGDWSIDRVSGVDEATGVVYFTANEKSTLERHLYRANLNTSNTSQPTRLTAPDGYHRVHFDEQMRSFIDYFSSPTQPPQVSIHGPTGQRIAWLHENKVASGHPLARFANSWQTPEFGSLEAADGRSLFYQLLKPPAFNPKQQYPVIMQVAGKPGKQQVLKQWGDHFPQYLAQQGYLVFTLDSRSSGSQGNELESGLYKNLAAQETSDQRAAVRFLQQQPYVDSARIGLMGTNYSGFVSLQLWLQQDSPFAAVAAGNPITDWRRHNQHLAERYLGDPINNSQVYAQNSVLQGFAALTDQQTAVLPPLLLHYRLDDHAISSDHSTELLQLLQQRGMMFEMMAYPQFNSAAKLHQLRLLEQFFAGHLKPTRNR